MPDRFADLAQALRDEGRDEAQVRKIVRAVGGTGFNLNLFPNIACSMAFFRVLRPVSVAETEIQHVAIGMGDGPVAANQARLRLHEHFQGRWALARPTMPRAGNASSAAPVRADLWIMLNRGVDAPEGRPAPGIMRAMPPRKWACARLIRCGRG
jgi:hypothetical protein